MKNIVILILICVLFVGLFIGSWTWQIKYDIETFNNGECECGGHFEIFDIENSSTVGHTKFYYYQCDECHNIIELQTLQSAN